MEDIEDGRPSGLERLLAGSSRGGLWSLARAKGGETREENSGTLRGGNAQHEPARYQQNDVLWVSCSSALARLALELAAEWTLLTFASRTQFTMHLGIVDQ